MTAQQFIEAIKTVPLSREEYAVIGFTGPSCEEHIANYTVQAKADPQDMPPIDELITLVSAYDVTRVPIALLWFDEVVSMDDDFYQVGTLAATSLCICRYTGETLIIPDYDIDDDPDGTTFPLDTPVNQRYRCARTGGLFLEALIHADTFLEKNCLNPFIFDNTPAIQAVAKHCAELAGGMEYAQFWEAFLRSEFL